MSEKIAVLAGTPVDTRMGAEILSAQGYEPLSFPLSRDPREQTAFQISPPEDKRRRVLEVLGEAQAQGCQKGFIYCNSLSAAVDFRPLAKETGMRLVTPMDVYRRLAKRYRSLGFIAANAQGLAGIERVLLEANPALDLLGTSCLPVVLSIEAGEEPTEILHRYHLSALCGWFRSSGMEALLLGCTHFPYLKEALLNVTDLPVIDPAEEMLKLLK